VLSNKHFYVAKENELLKFEKRKLFVGYLEPLKVKFLF